MIDLQDVASSRHRHREFLFHFASTTLRLLAPAAVHPANERHFIPVQAFHFSGSIPDLASSGWRQSIPASISCGTSDSINPSVWKITGNFRLWAKSHRRLCAGNSKSRYIAGDMNGHS